MKWLRFALLVMLLYICAAPDVKGVAPRRQPKPVHSVNAISATGEVTATPAPTVPIVVFQHSRVTDVERDLLVRLCVVEAFGMVEPYRRDACLSVISTVIARMETGTISDGTIAGTLGWYVGDAEFWQFPPWVVLGCDYVHYSACRDNVDPSFAEEAVGAYLNGERGSCDGYLFYNSIPGGSRDCLIIDGNQYIEFHTKAVG